MKRLGSARTASYSSIVRCTWPRPRPRPHSQKKSRRSPRIAAAWRSSQASMRSFPARYSASISATRSFCVLIVPPLVLGGARFADDVEAVSLREEETEHVAGGRAVVDDEHRHACDP